MSETTSDGAPDVPVKPRSNWVYVGWSLIGVIIIAGYFGISSGIDVAKHNDSPVAAESSTLPTAPNADMLDKDGTVQLNCRLQVIGDRQTVAGVAVEAGTKANVIAVNRDSPGMLKIKLTTGPNTGSEGWVDSSAFLPDPSPGK